MKSLSDLIYYHFMIRKIIDTLLSDKTEKTKICLYPEGKRSFEVEVSIRTKETAPPKHRFGIEIAEVDNFVADLLALEVDGRK